MSDSVLALSRVEEALPTESVIGETGEVGGDKGDTGMRGTSIVWMLKLQASLDQLLESGLHEW